MSKLHALWKQGWNEIPEVMIATIAGFGALPYGFYSLYRYYQNDGDNRRYKYTYIVMRSDDPRAKFIHKD